MKSFELSLLGRYSVVGFVVLAVLAVAIGSSVAKGLNGEIDLLNKNDKDMIQVTPMEGSDLDSIPFFTADARLLKWLIFGAFTICAVVMHGILATIFRRGWMAVCNQRKPLEWFS